MALSYGVTSDARPGPRELLDRSEAAAYLGIEGPDLVSLLKDRRIAWVDPPRVRLYQHFSVRALDAYLSAHADREWSPWPRYGRKRSLWTWQASNYLNMTEHQVRRLARLGYFKAAGGGQGTAWQFLVGDLEDAIDGWAKYW